MPSTPTSARQRENRARSSKSLIAKDLWLRPARLHKYLWIRHLQRLNPIVFDVEMLAISKPNRPLVTRGEIVSNDGHLANVLFDSLRIIVAWAYADASITSPKDVETFARKQYGRTDWSVDWIHKLLGRKTSTDVEKMAAIKSRVNCTTYTAQISQCFCNDFPPMFRRRTCGIRDEPLTGRMIGSRIRIHL